MWCFVYRRFALKKIFLKVTLCILYQLNVGKWIFRECRDNKMIDLCTNYLALYLLILSNKQNCYNILLYIYICVCLIVFLLFVFLIIIIHCVGSMHYIKIVRTQHYFILSLLLNFFYINLICNMEFIGFCAI